MAGENAAQECPACSSAGVQRSFEVAEMMFGIDASFTYAECSGCGTVRLVDVPTDMSAYYPSDYYSVDLDPETALGKAGIREFVRLVGGSRLVGRDVLAGAAAAGLRRRQFQTLMSILGAVRRSGLPRGRETSVLDVGCGSGMLIYAMGLAGMSEVVGVDPFAPRDRHFTNGVTLLRRDLQEVTDRFGLVMFHHSLEHVPDPGAALRTATALLEPGGHILVRMPNVSSEAFETYGPQWVQFDAPRHTTLFSRDGMTRLCTAVGLRQVLTWDDSTSFQFWGSEQVRHGIPLEGPTSHMVNPGSSMFSRSAIKNWDKRAHELNRAHRGDQTVWVLGL